MSRNNPVDRVSERHVPRVSGQSRSRKFAAMMPRGENHAICGTCISRKDVYLLLAGFRRSTNAAALRNQQLNAVRHSTYEREVQAIFSLRSPAPVFAILRLLSIRICCRLRKSE